MVMYGESVIKEREEGAGEILRALATRELAVSGKDMWKYNIGIIAHYEGKEAVKVEEALLAKGNEYFEQGYRIRHTEKKVEGITTPVPDDALAWIPVSAGHIGTASCYRIDYLVRK